MSTEWSAKTLSRLHDVCERFRIACGATGISLFELHGPTVALSWDEEHARARAKENPSARCARTRRACRELVRERQHQINQLQIADEHGFILSSAGLHKGTQLIWFIYNRLCLGATFKDANRPRIHSYSSRQRRVGNLGCSQGSQNVARPRVTWPASTRSSRPAKQTG